MNKLEFLRNQILSQGPTSQQKDAIFADELEFLLRAAPGSGKTWTSCRRFIWRGANRKYSAGGLALLSFTNAAIREFQAATIEVGRRDLLSDPNYVGTFDAFVERFILTPFGHLLTGINKRPKLLVTASHGYRSNKRLQAWTELKGGRKMPVPAWEIIPYPENGGIAFKASNAYGGQKLKGESAVRELIELGYYSHAQRVYWACILLFERSHIASVLARRFPEIVVDEAQDTNVWLLNLLGILREKGSRITLIGDPDQCIYEFSMANATSLSDLRYEWSIPEKPLSQSFRCNDAIALAVREIGGNRSFSGCGPVINEHCRPYIVMEPSEQFVNSVAEFERSLQLAGIVQTSAAIICRARRQLETILGETNFVNLEGVTKDLAQPAFLRDHQKNYKAAVKVVEAAVRDIADDSEIWERIDEYPDSGEAAHFKLAIWRFVKNTSGLPSISLSASAWIEQIRENLDQLIGSLGVETAQNLNQKIKKSGLLDNQMRLPLFEAKALFPSIRQETIHQVKGESIDGVLVLGSTKFWNSVVHSVANSQTSEDRRLAYVAMTRARHLLAIGLPTAHFDKHADKWVSWGFKVL